MLRYWTMNRHPTRSRTFACRHLNGGLLAEVRVPENVKSLKTIEDFQRLSEAFYLPAGAKELVRRGDGRRSKKGPAKPKPIATIGNSATAKGETGSEQSLS